MLPMKEGVNSMLRWFRCGGAAAQMTVLLALTASPAGAQQWPAKPITIVNGFPAGAGNDIVLRMYQEALEKDLGQPWCLNTSPVLAATWHLNTSPRPRLMVIHW